MSPDILRVSNLRFAEQQEIIERHTAWMIRYAGALENAISGDRGVITGALVKLMRSNLAAEFTKDFTPDKNRVAIFSGKSAPVHKAIFQASMDLAQATGQQLIPPAEIVFDDWQNQSMYLPKENITIASDGQPDPWVVIGDLRNQGVSVGIHEDHSRAGYKYNRLLQDLRRGLISDLYYYSTPAFPDEFWNQKVHYGLCDNTFNLYMASLSQLYSERIFLENYGCLRIFDGNQSLVMVQPDQSVMESLGMGQTGLHFLEDHLQRSVSAM